MKIFRKIFRRVFTRFADWLIANARRRAPDFIIGGRDDPYMLRWWLIPRNPIFNIYLHKFLRDDDDRALHDHPWFWCSILLHGDYVEVFAPLFDIDRDEGFITFRNRLPKRTRVNVEYQLGGADVQATARKRCTRGSVRFHRPKFAHRIELFPWWLGIEDDDPRPVNADEERTLRAPAWTLFITGPRMRNWGFHCPNRGWVPWQQFTASDDAGAIGKGCDA